MKHVNMNVYIRGSVLLFALSLGNFWACSHSLRVSGSKMQRDAQIGKKIDFKADLGR